MIKNPVLAFREANSLTQDQLANYAEVTRQVITKTEAGLFDYIPPSIMKVMQAYEGASALDHQTEYTQWIDEILKSTVTVSTFPPVGEWFAEEINSFVDWRFSVSQSVNGFCTLMKIQPIIISNYEKGRTQNLPEILKTRLRTVGVSETYILELERLPHHG
jgi:DNA-binding XRE family transcriptional regulator